MTSKEVIEAKVIEALKTVYDPEIPVNIYDLGLIYEISISDNFDVKILMTLTSPNCPMAENLPEQVKEAVQKTEGVGNVVVEITFDPPWSKEMMSPSAMLDLGLL